MLKLESLLAFVATAEGGSISEAARRLQISKSVASERLAELERNVGNGIIMRDAALESLGIALLATFLVHDLLISGELCVVDVGAEAEPAMIFIGYPTDRRVSAKVLALMTHLRTTFGTPPYWERPAS
jgi:DNA-binding transcriptional LysR family regulator